MLDIGRDIQSLTSFRRFPRRCPTAPEARRSGRRLRHLLYGAAADVYRVIYQIDQRRKTVLISTVGHGAVDEFMRR